MGSREAEMRWPWFFDGGPGYHEMLCSSKPAVRVEQCLERVGPCTPDGEPDESLVRAYLDDWERQHRLLQVARHA